MYNIIIDGKVVASTVLPNYVRYSEVVKSFETCDEAVAEALLVNVPEAEEGSFYADLENKTIRHEGFPVAKVEKVNE